MAMLNPLVKRWGSDLTYFTQLDAFDVRAHFGIKATATLPNVEMSKPYFGPRGRVMLHVFTKNDPNVNQNNNRAHRVFATCPACAQFIPFSRMQQHVKRKDHQGV